MQSDIPQIRRILRQEMDPSHHADTACSSPLLQNEHPDCLLSVLKSNDHSAKVANADLIIYRGVLLKLCNAGFSTPGGNMLSSCPWQMNVMLVSDEAIRWQGCG